MSFEIGLQKCAKQSCLFWLDFGHIQYILRLPCLVVFLFWSTIVYFLSLFLFIYFLVRKIWHYDIDENEYNVEDEAQTAQSKGLGSTANALFEIITVVVMMRTISLKL